MSRDDDDGAVDVVDFFEKAERRKPWVGEPRPKSPDEPIRLTPAMHWRPKGLTPIPDGVKIKRCLPGDASISFADRGKSAAQRERERRAALLERGLCVCGKRVRPGTTRCDGCWTKKKMAKRKGPYLEPLLDIFDGGDL